MQTAEVITHYTPAEYLALEDQAEFRSEYHDGEIIPMTGGSFTHNEIVTNLCSLKASLRNKGYRLFSSDVRVWIAKYRKFTYPDVMVIQGEPDQYDNRTDTLTNPKLIIEVLSQSSQEYDRGNKFKYYRSIPDLQEYVLINQYELEIQHYAKADGGFWIYRTYESLEDVMTLSAIATTLPLADIYAGISF
ncbi:MAG: Uma2 family endonuclease [Thermosynechococcaceae cyanobacterium]